MARHFPPSREAVSLCIIPHIPVYCPCCIVTLVLDFDCHMYFITVNYLVATSIYIHAFAILIPPVFFSIDTFFLFFLSAPTRIGPSGCTKLYLTFTTP